MLLMLWAARTHGTTIGLGSGIYGSASGFLPSFDLYPDPWP